MAAIVLWRSVPFVLKEFHLAQLVVRNNSARCFQQKLKDAFGELPSGFIRVTMRYAVSPYLVDFEVGLSFRGPGTFD